MPRVEQVQQKALEEFRERNRAAAKRKKNQNKRQMGEYVITFVCLFFLMSLFFLQVAKRMTPKVDTSIGGNVAEVTDTTAEAKGTIDDRLKLIQFNDALASGELQRQKEKEMFNEALEERVVIPSGKKHQETSDKPELNEQVQDIISRNLSNVQKLEPETQKAAPAPVPPVVKPVVPVPVDEVKPSHNNLDEKISAIQKTDLVLPKASNYKVLVGKYQTAEQAQLAKSIIRETSLGQNAFVKLIDNVYTIQIGSYSTSEQARAVADELTTKSFPARVYYEKPQSAAAQGAKTIF